MHKSASNSDGWKGSTLKGWLNSTDTDGFLGKLPFADYIAYYKKPAYCSTDNTAYSKIWLMSYKEITGRNNDCINNVEENACVQYDYFTYNNSWALHKHDDIDYTCSYWTRDIKTNRAKEFVIVRGDQDSTDYPGAGGAEANVSCGVAPCFVF